MKSRRYLYVSLITAAAILTADQLSKLWVRAHIPLWHSVPAEGWLRLTHVQNTGSAFGLFSSQTVVLTIFSMLAIVGLILALRYQPLRTGWASLTLGMLLGGSTGNLIDRIRQGYVTDFLDVGLVSGWRFYTFNVADSAITVGSIAIALILLRSGKQAQQKAQPSPPP